MKTDSTRHVQREKVRVGLLVFLSAVVFSLSFWIQLQAESTGRDVAEQLKPNVVQLTVKFGDKTSHGFGFVVGERSGNLYVVTAKHVVRVDEPGVETEVCAQFYERRGKFIKTNLLHLSVTEVDLALLEVPKPFKEYTWKALCYADLKKGDPVWFVGRNQEWFVPIEPGYVQEQPFLGRFYVEGLNVMPGSSGAPLISEEGIVGMIIEGGEDVIALSIDTVRQVVEDKWNYPWGLCVPLIPPPEIKRFTIEPSEVGEGKVRLTWEVEWADTVTIEPSIGTVNVKDSLDVAAPTEDTIYTLVAKNKSGQTEESIKVTMIPGATIIGKIYYNGKVVTEHSNAHAILASFYSPELLKDVAVDFRYDNQTGGFVFKHVPPGKYRVCIYIDSGYPFESHSAGDFYGCVGGLNDDVIVPPYEAEVSWDYKVVHQIHLLQPVDNQELRTPIDDPPETLYAAAFAWEPVSGASYYEVRILLKDGDTDGEVESRSETVTATLYSPNLNVTSGNEYYMFSVAAYNAQHELVGDFSNFYRNGSGGWFEFKLVSKPD